MELILIFWFVCLFSFVYIYIDLRSPPAMFAVASGFVVLYNPFCMFDLFCRDNWLENAEFDITVDLRIGRQFKNGLYSLLSSYESIVNCFCVSICV